MSSLYLCVSIEWSQKWKGFRIGNIQCQNLIATSVPYNKKHSVRQCSSRFGCDYRRMKEKFEDTKGVIRSHNSKNRHYKGQQNKDKKTSVDKTLHTNLTKNGDERRCFGRVSISRFTSAGRGVTIHFFHKRYVSRYLICITIRITIRFIGN